MGTDGPNLQNGLSSVIADIMPRVLIDNTSPTTSEGECAPCRSLFPLHKRRRIMPPERTSRTANPHGRQKACAECAKGKRRCDLRQPNCLRCTRQNLTCSYPPQPHDTSTSQSNAAVTGMSSFLLETPAVTSAVSLETPAASSAPSQALDFDLNNGFDCVDALNELLNEDADETFPITRPAWTAGQTFSTFHIGPYAQSRLTYTMEHIGKMPEMMVKEKSTHWCHPFLYEDDMPRSLQDAHAACALYITKNDTNATFVARHFSERALELAVTPLPSSNIEVLARVHALLLYLIMLVYSGDIRHAGLIGDIIIHLEGACLSLKTLVDQESDPTSTIPLYPSAAARTAWRGYILRETMRRTLLAAYHFIAACNLLRGRLTSCSHDLAIGNRVSFSAHLWDAKSPLDFAIAWNEKNHFLVKDLDITGLLETARPDDIDTYGKLMLTGILGIDDVKGWFYSRGGTL